MSVSLPFSAAAPHLLAYARGRPTGQDVDRPTLVFSPASTCMHGLPIMCSFFWFVGTWELDSLSGTVRWCHPVYLISGRDTSLDLHITSWCLLQLKAEAQFMVPA